MTKRQVARGVLMLWVDWWAQSVVIWGVFTILMWQWLSLMRVTSLNTFTPFSTNTHRSWCSLTACLKGWCGWVVGMWQVAVFEGWYIARGEGQAWGSGCRIPHVLSKLTYCSYRLIHMYNKYVVMSWNSGCVCLHYNRYLKLKWRKTILKK